MVSNSSAKWGCGQSIVPLVVSAFVLTLVLILSGCGRGVVPAQDPPPPAHGQQGMTPPPPSDTRPWIPGGGLLEREVVIRPGIDHLLAERLDLLEGKRVGLITNHTGRNAAGESTVDLLHETSGFDLIALFSPEHGIRGAAEAGERVASGRDEATGLPIHSLYGETMKPTPAMLEGLDLLIFDIQDIGTRYYTYIWTMALALEAAAEEGLEFIVLDRPNPLGGELVQGNLLDPAQKSFVGLYPVPMRHGLTVGEMAGFLNSEYELGADLTIVPIEGWRRGLWYDDTDLTWISPSPNMPSLESALHYPGSCLFEGTNLSVGRGTGEAFQQIGAPWLDHEELARRLEARGLMGVAIESVVFTPQNPGDGKFGGEQVRGIRFRATDREAYDPTVAAIAALVEIQSLHPERLRWNASHFDRLAGSAEVRERIVAGADIGEIRAGWVAELSRFEEARARYLLYR